MPNFCEKCGHDTAVCQVCGRIVCTVCEEPGIQYLGRFVLSGTVGLRNLGDQVTGNVCGYCHRIISRFTEESKIAKRCQRCGSELVAGRCKDETCEFHHHEQTCQAGWNGHPELDPKPEDYEDLLPCTCENHVEWNVYVCDFCGVYSDVKPRCNKCEVED